MKSIKKKGISRGMVFVLTLFLCSCSGKGEPSSDYEKTETNTLQTSSEIRLLEDENLEWSDNTLDDLHAVLNLPLNKIQAAEGEQLGGGENFICETGCVRFYRHRSDLGYWSEVNHVSPEGEESFLKITPEQGREKEYYKYDLMGPKSGERAFVASRNTMEKKGRRSVFLLYELDENFQEVQSVSAELTISDSAIIFQEIMGDAQGNFHVVYYGENKLLNYAVISSTGEILLEGVGENRLSLCAYGGGRVALCEHGNNVWRLYEADLEKEALRQITASKDEGVRMKMTGFITYMAAIDEYRVAWCTNEGLFFCDSRDGEKKLAYKWSNHGIVLPTVQSLVVLNNGKVGILYATEEGKGYLLLETTGEKKEMKSITFAVSSDNKATYQAAAAYFNKLYPTYNIDVTDDWNETSLLTKLGAGDGPVLIDTSLTGFDDLEKLWQPLDSFLEQTNLRAELMSEVFDFGRIGDVQYGIVKSFSIHTLVVPDSGPENWDYEGFLKALEEKKGAAPFCYWYFDVTGDRRETFFNALSNGLTDSYYVDPEEGNTIFGTERFDRILKLSDSARKCLPANEGKTIHDGKALCEVIDIFGIQQVVDLRMRLEANGERAIGYPTKEGAKHFFIASDPITMRVTATEEEKKIAYTFLKVLLSKECLLQSHGSMFYVRKDMQEEQIANYELAVETAGNQFHMAPFDREKDVALLNELIHNGTTKKSFPSSLQKVFDEEFGDYLSGRIDGKALSEHLKSRVTLYLQESK